MTSTPDVFFFLEKYHTIDGNKLVVNMVIFFGTYVVGLFDESGAAFAEPDIAICGLLDADLVPPAAVQVLDAAHGVHLDAAFRYCKEKERRENGY